MRPSFARVRSCVSSRPFERVSTFSLTSPTFCLTNFLVAQAVVPPSAMANTGMTKPTFFIMSSLLHRAPRGALSCLFAARSFPDAYLRFPQLFRPTKLASSALTRIHRHPVPPRGVAAPRADDVSVLRAHFERPPAGTRRRFEREHILVAQLAENLPRGDARVSGRARHEELSASAPRELLQ